MAFFKIRKSSDVSGTAPQSPQTLEGIRLHAIFRLIGSTVLVVAAIVGFPLVFDSQPRPIAVDVSIEIPDKSKISPLVVSKTQTPVPSAASGKPALVEEKSPEIEGKSIPAMPAGIVRAESEPKVTTKVESKAQSNTEQKMTVRPEVNAATKQNDGAKVLALLEDKGSDSVTGSRFVVQVGAFADATRARDARSKLEAAGLKTYTQVIETKDGQRTRVRVGPFNDKREADKVVAKIKVLGLSASILSL